MLKINRQKALNAFADYVKDYDSSNAKIKLKIDHTYRVCELCEKIAADEHFPKEDVDLAWLLGLLHDVGRFEQVRCFGTFNDSRSVNHAKCSVEVLFNDGKLVDYLDGVIAEELPGIDNSCDDSTLRLIYDSVLYHNVYRIPKDLPERTKMFCNLLRDADKIDIIKVNLLEPAEAIYAVSQEEICMSEVSDLIMDDFRAHRAVLRTNKKTAVDNVVGHISLAFELVYHSSYRLLDEQGCIYKLMEFQSKNPGTKEQFKEIKNIMSEYIKKML